MELLVGSAEGVSVGILIGLNVELLVVFDDEAEVEVAVGILVGE